VFCSALYCGLGRCWRRICNGMFYSDFTI